MIRRWRPWEKAPGPRTANGKARVARSAFKAERDHCCGSSPSYFASEGTPPSRRPRPSSLQGSDVTAIALGVNVVINGLPVTGVKAPVVELNE